MLMSIFWLQQTMADVPADNAWLCAREVLRLSEMKFTKRRNDWRLGRWTAKCAISDYLGWPAESRALGDIEIRPATSGAPEVFIADRLAALGVSLSHCGGRAIAALAPSGVAVGCDLERIEPRIDAFVTDYFTPIEQTLVHQAPVCDRPALVTLLWSAKESALKVLGQGLRLDTRSISVNIVDTGGLSGTLAEGFQLNGPHGTHHPPGEPAHLGWRALEVFCRTSDRGFYGWWQATSEFVQTLVADAQLLPPILLNPRP